MDSKLQEFQKLAQVFNNHDYRLYLVGGTVRDYLLKRPLDDMDAVTDAIPEEVVKFLPNVDQTFARLGSLKYKSEDLVKFDITTLRKESGYLDSRHPNEIIFVKDLKIDYQRRDFTINAMYLDEKLNLIDYCEGQKDLNNKVLRMVGDPQIRLKEDPLRILRAIRFCLMFNFKLDVELEKAMEDNFDLLANITDAKIRSELNKINYKIIDDELKDKLFKQFDIANLRGVIK